MSDQEHGKCEVCGKEGPICRTYIHFDHKCDCHSPNHFMIIFHCSEHPPSLVQENEELKAKIEKFKKSRSIYDEAIEEWRDGDRTDKSTAILFHVLLSHQKPPSEKEIALCQKIMEESEEIALCQKIMEEYEGNKKEKEDE